MSKRLVIIGAGGHGRVVSDIAYQCGYTDICFLDDYVSGKCMGYPIVGKIDEVNAFDDEQTDFVIAIGNNYIRESIAEKYKVNWITLVHPTAVIGRQTRIGAGTVVMAHVILNACSVVGKHCIINSASVVEHDNVLGDYVQISPRATLGGAVTVGHRTHIGIGAAVRNNIDICGDCLIGAGAVVVENLNRSATYIGVPAREMKKQDVLV